MDSNKISILERALSRERRARKQAETILESKSLELFNISKELEKANSKLENLLDEKRLQLKGVFDNINDAYIVMDIDGNILKINDIASNLFGYKFGDKNFNVENFIYNEDYPYAVESFKTLLKEGKFSNYTSRIITKNKEIKWVNINASIIYNKQKKPIIAQGIIRDITIQREKRIIIDLINNAAKSILGKEDIYEIAWEISSTIANYLSTDDCVIYLVNHKEETLEQIAAFNNKLNNNKEIINKIILPFNKVIVGSVAKSGNKEIVNDTSLDERYIVDDAQRFSEITVPIISEGKVIGVIDAEHKEKNYFTKEHLVTIQNIANLVAFQLKSAINLRERKKVETKNKELVKKLEKSNEELQEYAHIVSHDLKSPLRSISALTNWIKNDNIDCFNDYSLQNFKDIDITLQTMDDLISNILEYSSINSNPKKLSDDVNLNELINELKTILYVPKNITIKALKVLPTIKGDKIQLQQLFQNLISNAIKFNNKEKGFINIDFKSHPSFYKFSIIDNGIGIEKKNFDKIFKIFQSLKKSKDSTGIGLSIVKKTVDIYGGEIWVESEIDKGTTFHFTLKK